MFRPDSNRDRTDYSGILMPPDGYRLDRAVGTTYSLDLEALTAVAICLGLSEETDSKLMQNPIGMLNALQKVSDKIVLFCEAGQIKVPTKPTALSILLEKMVVEVALPKDRQLGRYPSFHPKTWVLAYVNADGDKKYRFVVMSRNLTFDRSWDISFAMDSSENIRQKKKTIENRYPKGSLAKITGIVMNVRPGPAAGSIPNAKFAGRIIKPAIKEMRRERTTIQKVELTSSVLSSI